MTLADFTSDLRYDPDTGHFWWLSNTGKLYKRDILNPAGTVQPAGYVTIRFNKKSYYLHRLAFLFQTGKFPTHQVDHINGNKSDNRWINLRESTQAQNMQNRSISRNNKSGYTGVYYFGCSWKANIHVDGRTIFLGSFDTKEQAAEARSNAKQQYHLFNPIDPTRPSPFK